MIDTAYELITHPVACLLITIGSYLVAQKIQKRCHGHTLANPVAISMIAVTCYLLAFDIPYPLYLKNVNLIHALLGPATVALAIPLYKQLPLIIQSARAIVVSTLVCTFVAALSAYFIALALEAGDNITGAIFSKSTTTAIAIGLAEKINADPSLTVFFVITTGILGSIIALPLFKLIKINDDRAEGLALGVVSHGIGTARAIQKSEICGSFSALGMSLMGIASGIILPFLYMWITN